MWLTNNNAILTKDNLIKGNWVGDPKCIFCEEDENTTSVFWKRGGQSDFRAFVATCFRADNEQEI